MGPTTPTEGQNSFKTSFEERRRGCRNAPENRGRTPASPHSRRLSGAQVSSVDLWGGGVLKVEEGREPWEKKTPSGVEEVLHVSRVFIGTRQVEGVLKANFTWRECDGKWGPYHAKEENKKAPGRRKRREGTLLHHQFRLLGEGQKKGLRRHLGRGGEEVSFY